MTFETAPGEQREILRKEARSFLTKRFPLDLVASMADNRPATLDREAWAAVSELGWTGTSTAEAAGGVELELSDEVALFEELGRALVPLPFFASVVLAQPLLHDTQLVESLVEGEAAFAVSPHGCCRAERSADGWSVSGRLRNVVELPLADRCLVRAEGPDGIALFAVDTRAHGATVHPFDTIDPARPGGDLELDGAEAELVLEPGELAGRAELVELRARIALAYESLGVAALALELSVDYAGVREQFGKPIGAFQAVAGRIADSYTELELAKAVATWALETERAQSKDALLAAGLAKAVAEAAAIACCESAVQVHGGIGCSWEHPLHRCLRRARWIAAQAPAAASTYVDLARRLHADGGYSIPVVEAFDGPEEAQARRSAREWIAANLPTGRRGRDLIASPEFESVREEWGRRLAATGALVAHWPEQYGGRDAFIAQSAIFREECVRAHPRLPLGSGGIDLVAPLLLEHGTEEQKERYLGPMRDEREIWGQGFSEPDAGSDLAALRTRATRTDDGWLLNGSKIWTTFGPWSNVFIVLARTDPKETRHRGITCFIVPREAPGIELRPIRDLSGVAELSEMFFDDTPVPRENVIGEVDKGWSVAMATLAFERATECTEDIGELEFMFDRLLDSLADADTSSDRLMSALGRLWTRMQAVKLIEYRSLLALKASHVPPPESAIIKLAWSETAQEVTSLAYELFGSPGSADPDDVNSSAFWSARYMFARAYTVYSGTSEILRSIVAERVLGLPRSR